MPVRRAAGMKHGPERGKGKVMERRFMGPRRSSSNSGLITAAPVKPLKFRF